MEQKVYKYKDIELKSAKRNLAFHRDNFAFIKTLQENILVDGKFDEEKFWIWMHNEENIKLCFARLLEGETDKINIEVETEEDYQELMKLLIEVLTDFFSSYKPLMKQ